MSIFITFFLLAFAILAVWLKPVRFNERYILPPWIAFFIASMVSGLIAGILRPSAIIALGAFCIAAYGARASKQKSAMRIAFGIVTAIFALALALHRLPGFNNPVVISSMALSAGAAAFTQYANFDKGAVGLILLALMCNRAKTLSEWRELLKQTYPIIFITAMVVLGAAMSIGYVKPDLKIPQATALFLATNLFFTVIAEEAFFRGFMQEQLMQAMSNWRIGACLAALISAVLFGIAHVKGGTVPILLAMLAGLGYGYAYLATKRIEASILPHFSLNALHFVAFTYPNLGHHHQ